MDREYLKKEMEKLDNSYKPLFTKKKMDIINKSINYSHEINGIKAGYNLIIASQELSELNFEITNALRGKYDEIGMIEEIADVLLCIEYIKQIFNISDMDIYKATQIKIKRVEEHISKDKEYL